MAVLQKKRSRAVSESLVGTFRCSLLNIPSGSDAWWHAGGKRPVQIEHVRTIALPCLVLHTTDRVLAAILAVKQVTQGQERTLTHLPIDRASHTAPLVALDGDFEKRWTAWLVRGHVHEHRARRSFVVGAAALLMGAAIIYAFVR